MKNVNPVVWFEIYVHDMDRAATFYEKVLDISLEKMTSPEGFDMEMRAFPSEMENLGAAGALVKMKDAIVGAGGTINYFGSQDCNIELARVEAAGGKICQPKMSIGEFGFCAIISDTEGNVVGLHSMV
mgnify:CR=1 FL=1